MMVLFMFLIGSVQASAIASIALDGAMSFLDPTIQAIIQGAMCAAGPAGALTCAVQYVQGKIIGVVSGEIMEQVARLSPEAYKAITTYNKIKSYIDRGASILQELKVSEEGEITGGKISFGEEEYSIKELFPESEDFGVEDVIVSNADYDFANRKLQIKENGFLKIKVKDEQGKITELTYENIKEGYLRLDEKGVVEEAEIISDDFSTYNFGDYEQIEVGAGTQIEYKNGILKVSGGNDYMKYGDLGILSIGEYVEFSGRQIRCMNCKVEEIRIKVMGGRLGVLERFDEGFLVHRGEATYRQNVLRVNSPREIVLIANPGVDLSDYEGNWIRQTDKLLEIQSIEGGSIDLEIAESHQILNTDSKDKLNIIAQEGDGLRIQKRAGEGLIPRVSHISSERGKTVISNDKMELSFGEKGLSITPPMFLFEEELAGTKKYQSVAFEIESNSPEVIHKLRINSYNQFVTLSEFDDELVSYNKYNLPVSALIEDNKLQTIEQLRKKYPGMKFEVPEDRPDYIPFSSGVELNKIKEDNVPPYMLYLTDEFLKRNPEAVQNIEEIQFSDAANAYGIEDTIVLGLKVIEPIGYEDNLIREMNSPIQILTHEYEHIKDNIIDAEETDFLRSLGNSRLDVFYRKRDGLEGELNTLKEEKNNELNEKLKDEIQMKIDAKSLEIYKIDKEIADFCYSKSSNQLKTLKQTYNDVAVKSLGTLGTSKGFKKSVSPIFNDIQKNYIQKELSELLQEKYNQDIASFIKQEIEPRRTEGEILKNYERDSGPYNGKIFKILSERWGEDTGEGLKVRILSNLDFSMGEMLMEVKPGTIKFDLYSFVLTNFDRYLYGTPELERYGKLFEEIVETNSGVPYYYSLKNYRLFDSSAKYATYSELSTTYAEQPLEVRKSLVNSGNKQINNMYKKLTQLAFDSGKMDLKEFKTIMGAGYCKKKDCSDMMCMEYKLLCCAKHPNSPNC